MPTLSVKVKISSSEQSKELLAQQLNILVGDHFVPSPLVHLLLPCQLSPGVIYVQRSAVLTTINLAFYKVSISSDLQALKIDRDMNE